MERDLEEQWKQRSDRQVAQAEERWKRKYADLQDECQQLQTQLSNANTKVSNDASLSPGALSPTMPARE